MNFLKKIPFTALILIGLVLGIAVGSANTADPTFVLTYIKPGGTLFLNLIKFIVVPIVFFSIICGIISMRDIRKVGSIGLKTLLFYLVTTACAVTIGLSFANLLRGSFPQLATSGLTYQVSETHGLIQTLVNMFPANIIEPFATANILQVIVIALFFGFAIILVGQAGETAAALFISLNEISAKIMGLIIKLSPLAVFCLIAPVVAENGSKILGSLAAVLLVTYFCYALHMLVVYSVIVRHFAHLSPLQFFRGMAPAIAFGFSSASSVGTLPLNLECTTRLGAPKEIASFTLPLGATINMDGTAIYQGVATVFIAACFGIDLNLAQMGTIVLTAVLASIGTAGVPGAGTIMLAMVLESIGLPIEGIALVAGIDRIFDMGRTTVNITGDAACTLAISYLESRKKN